MAPKRPNLVQNLHFWSFWAKYCHFLHILSNARPKNNVNKVPRWVFRYVGNKTFDFSSKKKDFLPKNDQIWPKIGIFGQFGPGHAGLPCWWVGWWLWRAGCISQDTYLLYNFAYQEIILVYPTRRQIFVGKQWSIKLSSMRDSRTLKSF